MRRKAGRHLEEISVHFIYSLNKYVIFIFSFTLQRVNVCTVNIDFSKLLYMYFAVLLV